MSGICGIVNFDGKPVDPGLLKKMAEAASYRGPDGIHYWIDDNVGFAHLALHTTPESVREHQPLVNRRGDIVLTADARVDNRGDLIRTLTSKGYVQEKDPTDADLILAAYECWGKACPKHIIGDFAFAIWDKKEQTFFGVRDALGVKRFHFSSFKAGICFASETCQLFSHPSVSTQLNGCQLLAFLANRRDNGSVTLFEDVLCLSPASRILVDEKRTIIERYWDIDLSLEIHHQSDQAFAEHFLSLFNEVIDAQTRNLNNTIGILVSGGLDSTSVAATSQSKLGKNELIGYSYSFSHFPSCDERVRVEAIKQKTGLEVQYIDAEAFDLLPSTSYYSDTPSVGWEPITKHVLSKFHSIGGKVILTGQGGDLILGGSSAVFAERLMQGDLGVLTKLYSLAREFQISYSFALYKCVIRPLVLEKVIHGWRRVTNERATLFKKLPKWINMDYVENLGECSGSDRFNDAAQSFRSLSQRDVYNSISRDGVTRNNVYWLERLASRFAIESRHPFLDRRLAEFVLALPGPQLYRDGTRKWILRQAMTASLPEVVLQQRRKTSLRPFVVHELQEKHYEEVVDLLANPALAKLGIVSAGGLKQIFDAFVRCDFDEVSVNGLWAFIRLESWVQEYYAAKSVTA